MGFWLSLEIPIIVAKGCCPQHELGKTFKWGIFHRMQKSTVSKCHLNATEYGPYHNST